ncbi:MAG: heme o synthase [Pseudomonadota bacterium]
MTDISAAVIQGSRPGDAEIGDYFRLLKPRVMSLVVFTALAGILAAGGDHPVLALASLICIAVGAGASGALNMWFDSDIDAAMDRTSDRPIPAGSVDRGEALALGLGLSVISVAMLALFANLLSAGLLAFTIFFYAVIYTMWLKRSTPQNIVIGGAAGAFPPMIGWAAVTGEITTTSVLLFMVIFLWTPPHFWALALFRNADYERVGVPMMPVVAGEAATRRQIFLYALVLLPVAIAPAFTSAGGPIYLVVATLASLRFLGDAWSVAERRSAPGDRFGPEKRLFGTSIVYLFAVFGALIADAVLRAAIGPFAWPVWF